MISMSEQLNDNEKKNISRSMVSVVSSTEADNSRKIKVTSDGVYAKIVVFEKENLTDSEIHKLLNVNSCMKIEVDKHYDRVNSKDVHRYTVYNILI